ncbi:MAG: Holliday junction branch migration protein RuvA [Muribaculaceae bacterium]|nr:Holliday junction branch migration protein RuvA [Muribaculaceae bacterium]
MIEYIKGELTQLTPAQATVETAGGVAYLLNITLPTYSAIEQGGAAVCRLYVHEAIRDDAWVLYGFAEQRERELFRLLIGVSGVGAATAVIILSSLQGDELAAVIAGGDVKRLKAIKGIGAKTAERIIVDLRDKIKPVDDTLFNRTTAQNDAYDEAIAALTILGFDRKLSAKVLDKLFAETPELKVETAIKRAMTMM